MEENKTAFAGTIARPQWFVMDPLAATGKLREHRIITRMYDDGREPETRDYALGSAPPGTAMPQEHALKFLADPSFIVIGPDGARVTPPPKIDPSAPIRLSADQTIARYDELQKSSLYKRCQVVPGGEVIQLSTPIEQMIAFLQNYYAPKRRGEIVNYDFAEKLAGGDMEQLPPKGLDALFGEEKSPLLDTLAP